MLHSSSKTISELPSVICHSPCVFQWLFFSPVSVRIYLKWSCIEICCISNFYFYFYQLLTYFNSLKIMSTNLYCFIIYILTKKRFSERCTWRDILKMVSTPWPNSDIESKLDLKKNMVQRPMGNIGEDYPHLITGGAMVDQVQHMLSG